MKKIRKGLFTALFQAPKEKRVGVETFILKADAEMKGAGTASPR